MLKREILYKSQILREDVSKNKIAKKKKMEDYYKFSRCQLIEELLIKRQELKNLLDSEEEILEQSSLDFVTETLNKKMDYFFCLAKDLIREIEEKTPHISLAQDEGLYIAIHRLRNEVYVNS